MKSPLDQELDLINQSLVAMGSLCQQAIASAITALLNQDLDKAAATIALDNLIDAKERDIEGLCLKVMLRYQPVARDLRLVSAALKMITDMERIGDQARDISEITQYITLTHPSEIASLTKMAHATATMVDESIEAFVNRDLELARQVVQSDDIVDNYFLEIKQELVHLIQVNGGLAEHGLDLLMISKYFERIGDHATNIAEWVEYAITGVHFSE